MIPHLQFGEVTDLKPLGAALAQTRSHALFKARDLEVMRLVLRAGEKLPPHSVAGEITLQCIEGRVELGCGGGQRELAAGQLIHLRGDEVHDLQALEDASLLLTIALRPDPHNGVKQPGSR